MIINLECILNAFFKLFLGFVGFVHLALLVQKQNTIFSCNGSIDHTCSDALGHRGFHLLQGDSQFVSNVGERDFGVGLVDPFHTR